MYRNKTKSCIQLETIVDMVTPKRTGGGCFSLQVRIFFQPECVKIQNRSKVG